MSNLVHMIIFSNPMLHPLDIKKAKGNLFPFLDNHRGKRCEGGVSKSLFQASPHPGVPV